MQFELEFGDTPEPTQKYKSANGCTKKTAGGVVVTTSVQTGRTPTPLERRFEKLWKQLEEKQQRQSTFDKEVERARTWIHTELAEKRAEYKNALVAQTEKLITHLAKKSLNKWQRTVLASWVEENFAHLENGGAAELPDLVRRYYTAKLNGFNKSERATIEEYYEESIEDILANIMDSAYAEYHDAEADSEQPSEHDQFEQARSHSTHTEDESFSEKLHAAQTKKKRQTFDRSIVNKLFRRTAKALHPDHEQDAVKKEQKHALMKTLLEARKAGNVAQIFKLYRDHVDSASIEIDLPDLKPMIDLLVQQIAELDAAFASKTGESAIHEWVGKRMFGRSEGSQLDALAQLKVDLDSDIKRLKRLAPYLVSLAKLKPLLEERYEMEMVGFY